jgi:hypothetical protein
LKTTDTVAYADMTALRVLNQAGRSSLLLSTPGLSANAPEPPAPSTAHAECDSLAGDPFDPRGSGRGMPFESIDPEQAVTACQAAVKAFPDKVQFQHELGRALVEAQNPSAAIEHYGAAAQQGYPAAAAGLVEEHQKGESAALDAAWRQSGCSVSQPKQDISRPSHRSAGCIGVGLVSPRTAPKRCAGWIEAQSWATHSYIDVWPSFASGARKGHRISKRRCSTTQSRRVIRCGRRKRSGTDSARGAVPTPVRWHRMWSSEWLVKSPCGGP